jgi:hypothetical protein
MRIDSCVTARAGPRPSREAQCLSVLSRVGEDYQLLIHRCVCPHTTDGSCGNGAELKVKEKGPSAYVSREFKVS